MENRQPPLTLFSFGTILLTLCIMIMGCDAETGIRCDEPLKTIGERCCIDDDSNSVCDVDEAVQAKEIDGSQMDKSPSETKQETAPVPTTQDKPETKEPDQPNDAAAKEEAAKETAELFATAMSNKQYPVQYAMFTEELKAAKTAEEFKAIMELDPFYRKLKSVRSKGVVVNGNTARASIEAKTNVQTIDIPEVTLHYNDGQWKVSAFVDVFELSTFDAACSGYRQSSSYTTEDCAFDLAKKVKGAQYCEQSGCHYIECLKALSSTVGVMHEAKLCRMCPPVMKTVNECILDIAKKYDKVDACNTLDDKYYSDKYCFCYGGFARYKQNQGFCNMIDNAEYKYACMKGFEGKYC